jgi:outer membrane protein assembly factor BamD
VLRTTYKFAPHLPILPLFRTGSSALSSRVPIGIGLLSLVGLLSLGVITGCASSDEAKPVTYSMTAKQNYERGLEELKKENFAEATSYFTFVKQKFPFSKYAALAELALADTDFARGGYLEAVDAYKGFARLHPTHEKAEDGYVSFRIAECYVKEMPGDWILLPPAYEKDQSAVRDALRELGSFLEKYPDSPYIAQARSYRHEVIGRLIEHEIYVARFYLERGHPKAAILRIRSALKQYTDSGREAELLLVLGETHLEMGNPASAKEVFLRVVNGAGSELEVKRAELFLSFIRRRFGDNPVDGSASAAASAPSAPPATSATLPTSG